MTGPKIEEALEHIWTAGKGRGMAEREAISEQLSTESTNIKDQDRLDIISGIGILHGIELRVHQKTPTFVLQIGESQIALDEDMVSGIYVRHKYF